MPARPFSGRDNAGATEQVSRLRDGESAGFDAVERAALPFPTHKTFRPTLPQTFRTPTAAVAPGGVQLRAFPDELVQIET